VRGSRAHNCPERCQLTGHCALELAVRLAAQDLNTCMQQFQTILPKSPRTETAERTGSRSIGTLLPCVERDFWSRPQRRRLARMPLGRVFRRRHSPCRIVWCRGTPKLLSHARQNQPSSARARVHECAERKSRKWLQNQPDECPIGPLRASVSIDAALGYKRRTPLREGPARCRANGPSAKNGRRRPADLIKNPGLHFMRGRVKKDRGFGTNWIHAEQPSGLSELRTTAAGPQMGIHCRGVGPTL
jgi:hypothetical protein